MDEKELLSEIKGLNELWMKDFIKGDAVAVGAHYTEDAVSLPPHSQAVVGREAIIRFWSNAIKSGEGWLNIQSKEVERTGDTAFEIGETELIGTDKSVTDRFNYMVIWKKKGDRWLIYREIWNSLL